jgi:inner membrane protein YidH
VSSETPERRFSSEEKHVEVADASRRTRLANERTYLAWWRTGLASVAVGIGAGRIVPLLAHGVTWPYKVAGVGFEAIGVAFIALAFARHRQVEQALSRGDFAPPDDWLIGALAVLGGLLGVVLVVALAVAD